MMLKESDANLIKEIEAEIDRLQVRIDSGSMSPEEFHSFARDHLKFHPGDIVTYHVPTRTAHVNNLRSGRSPAVRSQKTPWVLSDRRRKRLR